MASKSEYLNVEDVAALFGRSRASIYVERHKGEGLGALGVQVGKRLFWRRADVDAWFEQKLAEQVSE